MCFTIPKKIKNIQGAKAVLETGETVDIGGLTDCQTGDYLRVTGDVAVEKMVPAEAQAARAIIKEQI